MVSKTIDFLFLGFFLHIFACDIISKDATACFVDSFFVAGCLVFIVLGKIEKPTVTITNIIRGDDD